MEHIIAFFHFISCRAKPVVEQVVEDAHQLIESVEQTVEETKQLIESVEQTVEETKQLIESVEQTVDETHQLVESVEQTVDETVDVGLIETVIDAVAKEVGQIIESQD